MNKLSFILKPTQQFCPAFGAKNKNKNTVKLNTLSSDVVEFSTQKKEMLPKKIELSESEKIFDEVLVQLNRIERNIRTQKQNLRAFYSSQDKADYQDLLRERRQVFAKLKRVAKSLGKDYIELESNIDTIKTYNWFAPKIYNAKSIDELNQLKDYIKTRNLYPNVENMLQELIEQRKAFV